MNRKPFYYVPPAPLQFKPVFPKGVSLTNPPGVASDCLLGVGWIAGLTLLKSGTEAKKNLPRLKKLYEKI